jgi:hypothetical protein
MRGSQCSDELRSVVVAQSERATATLTQNKKQDNLAGLSGLTGNDLENSNTT